jgi:hypothetical protein
MRPLLLLATLALFCACPAGTPSPPENLPDGSVETPTSKLPPDLRPPTTTTLERAPAGPGLPSTLKPPAQ